MEKIAIIGAGITGVFTAFLLARNGHEVVLLDAESDPYRGTSWNPGGINPLHGPGLPDPMAGFYLSSHAYHAHYREEVQELSGIDYGFRVIDRLFLAFSSQEQRTLLEMLADYNAREGFHAEWYTAAQVQLVESRISDQAVGGLMTHGNIVVDSERYCEALKAAAVKLGCRWISSDVSNFIAHNNRITHVVTSSEKIECSAAILAAGYLTDRLSSKLGIRVPVKPLKGELLLIKLKGRPFGFDVTHSLTGLYQYKDDLYWLGGTTDDPSLAPGTTQQGKTTIVDNCRNMLPGMGEYDIVTHVAGYRPVSADKLPVVGRLHDYENLFIGTGGGSKGILVSSGIGMALLELIERRTDNIASFLSPERFHVPAKQKV